MRDEMRHERATKRANEAPWRTSPAAATLLVAMAALLVGGCGNDTDTGASTGYTQVGDVQEGGTLGDSAAADVAIIGDADDVATAADGAGADSAAVEDTAQPDDTTAADATAVDTVAADTGSADTGSADTGPADTGSADTATADTGSVDAGGPCADKVNKFNGVVGKAKACADDLDCYGHAEAIEGKGWVFGAPIKPGCSCQTYYNGGAAETQAVVDIAAEYTKAGCPDSCPDVDCQSLKGTIGACVAGACQAQSLTCAAIEAAVKKAVAIGRSCTSDDECSPFGMQGELPCGCGVNVNLNKMAPGKPVFLYVTMMAQAYVAMACAKDVVCACPSIGPAACKAGICETK